MIESSATDAAVAGLRRTAGAILYDALLLFSILFFATAVLLLFTGGEAIPPGRPWFTAYLFAVTYIYFASFWVHGGQTLGMRAWHVKLVPVSGDDITWSRATARFACAMLSWLVLGAGFLWALFDPARMTWHDRLSGTRLLGVDRGRRRH